MNISDEMVHAGVEKALELGLLPRKSVMEDIATNCELMQEILLAALNVAEYDDAAWFDINSEQPLHEWQNGLLNRAA
jgi:hypothetical protein